MIIIRQSVARCNGVLIANSSSSPCFTQFQPSANLTCRPVCQYSIRTLVATVIFPTCQMQIYLQRRVDICVHWAWRNYQFYTVLVLVKHRAMEDYVGVITYWASHCMDEENQLQRPETLLWRKSCGRLVGSQSRSRRYANRNHVHWQGFVSVCSASNLLGYFHFDAWILVMPFWEKQIEV